MAVPKRKVSSARRDKRRSNVWKLDAPALVECPNCHELKQPHKVCAACGCSPVLTIINEKPRSHRYADVSDLRS